MQSMIQMFLNQPKQFIAALRFHYILQVRKNLIMMQIPLNFTMA